MHRRLKRRIEYLEERLEELELAMVQQQQEEEARRQEMEEKAARNKRKQQLWPKRRKKLRVVANDNDDVKMEEVQPQLEVDPSSPSRTS